MKLEKCRSKIQSMTEEKSKKKLPEIYGHTLQQFPLFKCRWHRCGRWGRSTVAKNFGVEMPHMTLSTMKEPDIASASVADTLAALHVDPETGLSRAEVDTRRNKHGYNEVAAQKGHPVLKFLGKFWGLSAWMLELIMVLSAVLRKYSDLAVVGALLVVNAVLSFAQEHRAAGVVEALRRRLQVSARVRRNANWQVIPARELVPGDIVRVRPGDIIPADIKLLTGALSVDQSALTG